MILRDYEYRKEGFILNRVNFSKGNIQYMDRRQNHLTAHTQPNYMSVLAAALRKLEMIEMVRRTNGQYRLYHAVSKKQKVILNTFVMNENDVRSTATRISCLLTADQSLQCSSKTEENEKPR